MITQTRARTLGGAEEVMVSRLSYHRLGRQYLISFKTLQLQIKMKGEQGLQSTDLKSECVLFHVQPFLLPGDFSRVRGAAIWSKLKPLVVLECPRTTNQLV